MSEKIRNIRILVADDHELIRLGVGRLLQSQRGLQLVGEAADGREAVEKAKKLRPTVAIVDIEMPELDGLQVTREIRATVPETQVLILTLHEADEMVRQVLDAGASGFVLKSDLACYLVKAVRAVSQGKIALTPRVSTIVLNGFLNARKESTQTCDSEVRPTPRENEIIRLLAQGKVNKEVAAALGITVKTVDTYRARIMLKLNLHSISGLVRYAVRHKLIEA